ncbi:anti-repressor SinI family protein [Virgibacillus sp. 179-BFC.A HS]|uniref:Anti-repressor SinI family protein n=1 Tax=Tigheibacillus jepli TaxID=3035914 RepID=A0ABU5CFI9_9BACI|nr:anti-repressor SinI family protein [Virgibacillus sp. 179-BFC.A HS]MDY0405073.1 anti-repressor SinI family protein [Virgibacillus sp. 179-BFC.A HS]
MTKQIEIKPFDKEWIKLISEAKKLGMTGEEVRAVLSQLKRKTGYHHLA